MEMRLFLAFQVEKLYSRTHTGTLKGLALK